MIKKIKKMKDRVHELLVAHPHLRDSDDALIANIWREDLRRLGFTVTEVGGMNAFDLLKLIAKGNVSSFEAVGRARRKIQEHTPELRGVNYRDRISKQIEVRDEIKNV